MEIKTSSNKTSKIIMAVVLIVVLLTFCVFAGTMIAWLTDRDERDDGGNIHIGSVDFDIYSGGTLITSTKNNAEGISPTDLTTAVSHEVEVAGSTTIRNIDLTIRNTGTVSAIMRVTLSIKYLDAYGQKVQCLLADNLTLDNQISINNAGWVNAFAGNNTVAAGYTYYNSQIKPYTVKSINGSGAVTSQDITANEVDVLTQILVPDSMISAKYYITLTVEGVAYSGNIYQEEYDDELGNPSEIPVSAYPFGKRENLPATWNAWKSASQL